MVSCSVCLGAGPTGGGGHPRPRRRSGYGARSAVLGALDEGDGVADGLEVLDLVVGDLDVELLLGGDDDLDHGQRVDVEVLDERLVELDVVGGNAGDLVDDVGEVRADLLGGSHSAYSFRWGWVVSSCSGPRAAAGNSGG